MARKYQPFWVSVSNLNQNSDFGCTLILAPKINLVPKINVRICSFRNYWALLRPSKELVHHSHSIHASLQMTFCNGKFVVICVKLQMTWGIIKSAWAEYVFGWSQRRHTTGWNHLWRSIFAYFLAVGRRLTSSRNQLECSFFLSWFCRMSLAFLGMCTGISVCLGKSGCPQMSSLLDF